LVAKSKTGGHPAALSYFVIVATSISGIDPQSVVRQHYHEGIMPAVQEMPTRFYDLETAEAQNIIT
jgi:hypothetical protein